MEQATGTRQLSHVCKDKHIWDRVLREKIILAFRV